MMNIFFDDRKIAESGLHSFRIPAFHQARIKLLYQARSANLMKSVVMLMLNAALLSPLFAMADEYSPAVTRLATTLRNLQYPNGLHFEAETQPDAREVAFDIPKGMHINEAVLRIVYRGSSRLGPGATLSVGINGLPALSKVVLPDQVIREWLVPVPASEWRRDQVSVTFSGQIPEGSSLAMDGQPQSGVIHVLSDTQMDTLSEGYPQTLRNAWLTLPEQVVVSIPKGPLDEVTFKAALGWVTLLMRHHHTVHVTTLPDIGNLVIASEQEIISALALAGGEKNATAHTLWGKDGQNVGVVNFDEGTFIAATSPYADVERFAARWPHLLQTANIEETPVTAREVRRYRIPLDEFGVSTSSATLNRRLQWTADVTPWSLPPGAHPDKAVFLVQMPRAEPEKLLRFYIYMNGLLMRSDQYVCDGSLREIAVPFSRVARSDAYHLRIVARGDVGQGIAESSADYSVRIAPQSYLTVGYGSQEPSGFSSMPAVLGSGFDLYLTKEEMQDASRSLPLIGELLAGFMVPATDYRIVVQDPKHVPSPQRNFLAVGVIPPVELSTPLRFDEGRIQLVDYQNEVLVDDRNLRQGSVLQFVKRNGLYGIWLHPGIVGEIPPIDANGLGNDDVAVYAQDRLVLSFDAHQEDLVTPRYLSHPRWYERLYNARLEWLLFAWLLLTAGFGYLYVKTRQHRSL